LLPDLNQLNVRQPRKHVVIQACADKYLIKKQTDLSDHLLVVGERYQNADISMTPACFMGKLTSGVMGK
jgi:hypothetical protein